MTLTELLRVADESRDDEMRPSQITCNDFMSRDYITVMTVLKPRSCGSYAHGLLLDNNSWSLYYAFRTYFCPLEHSIQ